MQRHARTTPGAHRKRTNAARNRVALAVAATGAITTAGAGGAAVAAASDGGQDALDPAPNYELAADPAPLLPPLPEFKPEDIAPQILSIAEFKPVADLADQVQKAIDYHTQRVAEDMAARAPEVVRPAQGMLTSGFGSRWGTVHRGVDIANSLGTPIVAAEDGTVIDAGPASGFGQWVRILHDDGTVTVYGHMETIDVAVGQKVTAGQKIAGMGSRGFSTGVHLHFEVHPSGGGAIDPIPWLASRGVHL